MTTFSSTTQFRLCPVYIGSKSVTHYVCRNFERCCKQGCCSVYTNKYSKFFQTWYFWLIVLLVFVLFYFCTWYCKKVKVTHVSVNVECADRLNSTPESSAQSSPRRHENVDYFLNCLLQSYSNRRSQQANKRTEPPPNYQDALNMPKCQRNDHPPRIQIIDEIDRGGECCSENEPPPTYEDVTTSNIDADPK